MKGNAPIALLACLLSVLPAALARAQVDTGSIVGTVTDASGGVLPGATVTAVQQGTATTLVAVTNDKGQYVFPTLKIGIYTVTAELQGFKKAVQQGVELHVQQRADVSLQLPLGQVNEEVVVSGRVELLQTQTADMGHAVDQRQLTDLPLLGRRYAELAFLQTGVVQAPVGLSSRGEDTFFNANGNYATWNNFMLDGADNNSFSTNLQERSAEVIQPPVDALQEFKVQTRTYSAEFGKSAGAVINASIKQGTNAFRGNVFEFFRDEQLNANSWDNNRAGRAKNQFNQHIAGFTIGGPLVRSRSFFFGDYQATRTDRALTQLATVPTPLMRAGNLVELTRPMTAGSPFVGAGCIDAAAKTVSPGCIDPVAAAIMNLYPMPNIPSAIARQGQPGSFGVPNYISNGILHHDVNQFDVRADHNLRQSRDQVFGRFSYMKTTRREPPTLDDPVASGDFSSNIFNTGQSAVGGWTRVISDRMLNEARFAWNQIDSDVLHLAFGIDAASKVGLRGVPTDPRYSGGLPHTTISGLTRIGGPFFRPQFQTSHVWQFADHLTWNRGSHALKFGFEKRRDAVNYIDLRALNGLISFSDARYTNVGYADFLLGLAASEGLTLFHEADLFTDGWQLYGQDAWRPTSSLTVDYGVRYEYFTPMQDRQNILTNIVPASGAIVTAANSGSIADRTLIQPDRNNIAPRAGFAYTFNPSLALRGGYGIFYQETDRYGSESQLALNPPQLIDVNLNANSPTDTPAMILRNGFVSVSGANVDKRLVQWRIQDPNQKTPIVHQFSIGPEYQFGRQMVVSAEYVGNRIRNGRRLRNLNQGIIQGTSVVFPYAQYGFANAYLEQIVTVGRANYDSLQTKLQRRFSDGLGLTVSYTYGRARGDFLDHLSAGNGASGNVPQNAHNMAADYGRLPFDIRHRLSTSFVYELPWGAGRRFKPTGIAGAIVSDWSANGVLSVSSGRPFTIASTDRSNTGPGHTSRANCIGNPLPSGFDQTIDRWFDATAFAEPSAFTFGSCDYNTMVGPGAKSMNFSVFRSIALPDQRRIELRVETFNLFNWVNYDFPGMSVSNQGTFGRITSSLGDPREMQLAVKLYF